MSRHNEITLYGKLLKDPSVRYDEEMKVYKNARFAIMTVQGDRDLENYIDHLNYQTPWILTKDPVLAERVSTWHQNDMIEIKGTITTQEGKKKTPRCPNCNQQSLIEKANIVYITPIYIDRREQNVTDEQALRLLKKRCEISNHALIVGTLCRNPETFTSAKGKTTTSYQLAINRKYFIKSDDPLVKTDYPWVKSFGEIAKNDAQMLMTGSEVLIDGYLHTREVTRKQVCDHCGHTFEWNDQLALEITPYSIEYLKNCRTQDEIDQKEDEIAANLADQILQ